MTTVNVKPGMSPALYGAAAGVILLIIIQLMTSGLGGGTPTIMPSLAIDGNLLDFIADYLGYFFTTTPGLLVVGATILFYVTGTYYVQKSTGGIEHETAALMRGLLIGLCSGMNLILAYNIYGLWLGQTVGLVIGLVLFALGILAAVRGVSQNNGYQGVIGWLSWLAPMSWPVLLLGVALLLVSLVLGLIGLAGVNLLRVGGDSSADASVKDKIATANWATGTFFLVGGLASNANFQKTAFNMGNVGFIHRKAQGDHREHESGHNLNLFTFGWIVHYIGAVDENLVGYREKALAELLAESNDGGSGKAKLQMWL